ncbi:MAG: hypothetical protein HY774_00120 [Acidobacteria bacterium]|nr:hypothetical protein [Acidobacteriota bacterium]
MTQYTDRVIGWLNQLKAQIGSSKALRIAVLGPQRRHLFDVAEQLSGTALINGDHDLWPLDLMALGKQHHPVLFLLTPSRRVAEHFFELSTGQKQQPVHRVTLWLGEHFRRISFPHNADENWQMFLGSPSLAGTETPEIESRPLYAPRLRSSHRTTSLRFISELQLDPVNERQVASIERLVDLLERYDQTIAVEAPECRSDAIHLIAELKKKVHTEKPHPQYCHKCRTDLGK